MKNTNNNHNHNDNATTGGRRGGGASHQPRDGDTRPSSGVCMFSVADRAACVLLRPARGVRTHTHTHTHTPRVLVLHPAAQPFEFLLYPSCVAALVGAHFFFENSKVGRLAFPFPTRTQVRVRVHSITDTIRIQHADNSRQHTGATQVFPVHRHVSGGATLFLEPSLFLTNLRASTYSYSLASVDHPLSETRGGRDLLRVASLPIQTVQW